MKNKIILFTLFIFLIMTGLTFAVASDIVITWKDASFSPHPTWWFVKDHYGFNTRSHNGSDGFWYTFSMDNTGQWCEWRKSISGTKKYEVYVWIPKPDAFDPTPKSSYQDNYYPTNGARYRIYTSNGKKTIYQSHNVSRGDWVQLKETNGNSVFEFSSEVKVTLGDDTSEGERGKRAIAFDAVKFVEVVYTWYKDNDDDGYSDYTTETQSDRPSSRYKLFSELRSGTKDYCDNDPNKINPGNC